MSHMRPVVTHPEQSFVELSTYFWGDGGVFNRIDLVLVWYLACHVFLILTQHLCTFGLSVL